MKNKTYNIVLQPRGGDKDLNIIRLENKSEDFLEGYIKALEDITDSYEIFKEEVV